MKEQGPLDRMAATLLGQYDASTRRFEEISRELNAPVPVPETVRQARLDEKLRLIGGREELATAFANLPVTESEADIGVITPTKRDIACIYADFTGVKRALNKAVVFRMALFYYLT